MDEDKDPDEDWVGGGAKLLSVIHEGNNPRVCLRNDKIIHIKEDGEFIHREVLPDRSIHEFSVHQCVRFYLSMDILTVKIRRTID